MKCLLDHTVRNAQAYYEEHNFEPSPAGDITVADKEITVATKINFEMVLTAMKAGGPKGSLLVVTHSGDDGLMMDLVAGGTVSAKFDTFDKILEIMKAIELRDAIDKAPRDQQAKKWREWFGEYSRETPFEKGWETVEGWQKEIQLIYQSWFDSQAKDVLGMSGAAALSNFIRLWREVRKAGFARLEFRACDIGSKADRLKALASFLNTKVVVAPRDSLTFFGKMSLNIVSAEDYKNTYEREMSLVRKFDDVNVLIRIVGEDGKAYAVASGAGKAFIKKYIHNNPKAKDDPFIIGGLEPRAEAQVAGKRQVFPAEKEYKDFLTKVTI